MTSDDRFFPCNDREADILNGFGNDRDGGARLEEYKHLRNKGATVTEALDVLGIGNRNTRKEKT